MYSPCREKRTCWLKFYSVQLGKIEVVKVASEADLDWGSQSQAYKFLFSDMLTWHATEVTYQEQAGI